jgi:hypothetical protein
VQIIAAAAEGVMNAKLLATNCTVLSFLFAAVTGAQTKPCTYFTVVTQDKLNNVKQGLSSQDVKWFRKSIAKKYPGVCYAEPSPSVPIIFVITVTPDDPKTGCVKT